MVLRFVEGKLARVEFLEGVDFNAGQFTEALRRANSEGVKIVSTPSKEKFATSGTDPYLVYPVSIENGCTCLGYTNGHLCKHFAKLLWDEGLNVPNRLY